jgi:nitrogen regulatory protein PII
MVTPLRKLTLVCPREIRPQLADALDAIEPPLPGYTVVDASGHGPEATLVSAAERVQGAMRSAMFILVLPKVEVQRVLDAVAQTCRRPQIAFWTEPVEDFGRLQ